jgi:hypothetical protein
MEIRGLICGEFRLSIIITLKGASSVLKINEPTFETATNLEFNSELSINTIKSRLFRLRLVLIDRSI